MQARFRGIAAIAWLISVVASVSAVAHHSYTEFDNTQSIEIDGIVLNVAWQNPHALIEVQTADPDGDLVTWEIESSGVNYLRRLQMPLEILKVGSRVKVAGWPSKRSGVRLYGTNILSDDGQEFVLWRSKPRWADTALRLCCRSLRYGRHGCRKRCHDISRVVIRFRFFRQAR